MDILVTVTNGVGHTVELSVDGEPSGTPVPIDADPFTTTLTVARLSTSGPLGTFARVDTRDMTGLLSTIGNPVYLVDPATTTTTTATTAPPATVEAEDTGDGDDGGSALPWVAGGAAAVAALTAGALALRHRSNRPR